MPSILRMLALVFIPAALALSCGEKEADTASADSAAAADTAAMAETGADTAPAVSPEGSTAQSTDPSSRPVTAEDIDRWQKGMAGEMEALQSIAEKVKTAKTTEDKLTIMAETQEGSTAAAGAKAAGLDETRYNFVRAKLSGAVQYLTPLELKGMPANLREEQRAQGEAYLRQMAWAVPPDVVEALRPRAAELRKQDLGLAVERLRASGMR
jgi:hypothetical protein